MMWYAIIKYTVVSFSYNNDYSEYIQTFSCNAYTSYWTFSFPYPLYFHSLLFSTQSQGVSMWLYCVRAFFYTFPLLSSFLFMFGQLNIIFAVMHLHFLLQRYQINCQKLFSHFLFLPVSVFFDSSFAFLVYQNDDGENKKGETLKKLTESHIPLFLSTLFVHSVMKV